MKRALFFTSKFFIVKKTREIEDGLEKIPGPKNKVHTLLGTSLGFGALYKIERGSTSVLKRYSFCFLSTLLYTIQFPK